jgi:hypothetical protein
MEGEMNRRRQTSCFYESFDAAEHGGRGRCSHVLERRSRSPTPHDGRPLQPFDDAKIGAHARRRGSSSSYSADDISIPKSVSRSSSPSRSVVCPASSCGELATTRRSLLRTCGIITVALAVLAGAASVPKLSRVEIDVDYSHMMGKHVQDQLLQTAVAHGRHRRVLSPSASHVHDPSFIGVFDQSGGVLDDIDGNGKNNNPMRLRGGDSASSFSPSSSTCDLKAVLRGGSVSQECKDTKVDAPAGLRGGSSRPKLSRTVDIH